jgi:hypothetical protein
VYALMPKREPLACSMCECGREQREPANIPGRREAALDDGSERVLDQDAIFDHPQTRCERASS